MKTRHLILVLCLFVIHTARANEKDSLQNLLNSGLEELEKIAILDQLAKSTYGTEPDEAIEYALQASELARTINDAESLGYALKNAGLGHYYKGDFVQVLQYWQESLSAFESINNAKGISNLLSNIGAVYYSTGDNTKAIEHYLRALRIAENAGDEFRVATVLQNIGAVYENTFEYNRAKEYLLQAIEMCKKLEYEKGVGTISLNLGEIYLKEKNYSEASKYFVDAVEYFKQTDDNFLPAAMIMVGKMDAEQKNYSAALENLIDAYEVAREKGGKVAMAMAQNEIGNIYLNTRNPDLAITAFDNALDFGLDIGVNEDLEKTYLGLTEGYEVLGDYKNAFRYQDSLIKTTKHLYDIDNNQKLSNLQLAFDLEKKQSEITILNTDIAKANIQRNFLMATAAFFLLLAGGALHQYQYIRKTNKIITEERNKSDSLLLNILPEETAKELKLNGSVKSKKYDYATVLFTDFVDFTGIASTLDPEKLVESVDYYFRNFDEIIGRHNMEKIKTIGDAYMCVGGLPKVNSTNAIDAIKSASDILDFVEKTRANPPKGIAPFQIRIGINSGPLVAGVVGTQKFQYDIWGDTVNVASRMETNCEANQINVSEKVFDLLKNDVPFKYRGEIDVKNRGKMKMYYLDSAQMS